jgi:hypothetical protein
MSINVTFNSNSLQTANIIVSNIDHGSTPDTTLNIFKLAKAPRSTVTSALNQQKTIILSGSIVGSSIADCDAQIDTFKGYLIGTEKNLDIDYNGSSRRYVATKNKATIDRPNNLAWASFQAEFICSQPYGTDTGVSSLLNVSARTSATYSDTLTVGGNAEWQTPIITITITALTGGTNATVTIGNANNGQACAVTRTWLAGEVLVIDTSSINNPVTVNGGAVDFAGALPNFNVGSQVITYHDTFSTRTFNYLVQNYNRWE